MVMKRRARPPLSLPVFPLMVATVALFSTLAGCALFRISDCFNRAELWAGVFVAQTPSHQWRADAFNPTGATPIFGARVRHVTVPPSMVGRISCQQLTDTHLATDDNGRFELRRGLPCDRPAMALFCIDHAQFEPYSFYWISGADTTPAAILHIYLKPRGVAVPAVQSSRAPTTSAERR